jgi:hypothetical protein
LEFGFHGENPANPERECPNPFGLMEIFIGTENMTGDLV